MLQCEARVRYVVQQLSKSTHGGAGAGSSGAGELDRELSCAASVVAGHCLLDPFRRER